MKLNVSSEMIKLLLNSVTLQIINQLIVRETIYYSYK